MRFSVIVATRDRPELLPRSLKAVAAQTHRDLELIVIDDSTAEETRLANAALVRQICPGVLYLPIPEQQRGQGPSVPRNYGIAHASGEFVAFLDDDDEWIDAGYLRTVDTIVMRERLDVHFADQAAVLPNGDTCPSPIWTEDLGPKLAGAGFQAAHGTYVVAAEQMLLSGSCAHLNTTVVRRSLVDAIGGFDERLTYEEDKDFYYRLLDRAGRIGYTARTVARHYVPAGAARQSASTKLSEEQKDATRLRYLGHLMETARLQELRQRARREWLYAMKRSAHREAGRGNFTEARRMGAEALRAAFGFKWAGYLVWLWFRGLLAPRSAAQHRL